MQSLPRKPNFASRFDGELTAAQVRQALTQRADRDDFIDAYIRWQLTSFKPEGSWSDQEFAMLLRSLPSMIENPRGEQGVVDLLERAAASGPLIASDVARLQAFVQETDERAETAQEMNRPAQELREWLHEDAGTNGPRQILLLMEHVAATIDGAWATQSVKRRLTAALAASADDDSMNNAQRRVIAQHLQNLVGRHRRYVNVVTFMADGSVNVTFSNARVTQRDVDAWIERMAGER